MNSISFSFLDISSLGGGPPGDGTEVDLENPSPGVVSKAVFFSGIEHGAWRVYFATAMPDASYQVFATVSTPDVLSGGIIAEVLSVIRMKDYVEFRASGSGTPVLVQVLVPNVLT